jgi:hypothetical protein
MKKGKSGKRTKLEERKSIERKVKEKSSLKKNSQDIHERSFQSIQRPPGNGRE